MAHDRHAALDEEGMVSAISAPPSSLTAEQPVSAIMPGGGAEGLLRRFLVAAERQVDDDQAAHGAAHHRRAVRDHHLQRDRQGAVEAVDDHAERVADQQEIDMRIEQPGDRRGIGGQPTIGARP